jgi:hypothetical protein
MSSYPNMSYCMCENTLLAMKQIVNAMQDEGPMFLKEMNRDERRAYEALFEMCESFMTMSEELQEELEHDGQPDEAQEWESFDPDC